MSAPAPPDGSCRVLLSGAAGALADPPGLSVARVRSAAEIPARLAEESFDCLVVDLVEAGGADGLRALRRAAPSAALIALACRRALTLAGASREEQAATRRLFAALQQALLASQG